MKDIVVMIGFPLCVILTILKFIFNFHILCLFPLPIVILMEVYYG